MTIPVASVSLDQTALIVDYLTNQLYNSLKKQKGWGVKGSVFQYVEDAFTWDNPGLPVHIFQNISNCETWQGQGSEILRSTYFPKCETWRDEGGWWQNTEVALSLLSGISTASTRLLPAQEGFGEGCGGFWWVVVRKPD